MNSAGSSAILGTLLFTSCASVPVAPPSHVGPVTGIAVTSDGTYSCSQAGVETPTGWIIPDFRAAALDARDDRVLVGGGNPAESGEVAVYANGEKLSQARIADDLVYAVALHPDGKLAAAGCADGSVRLLNLPDLSVLRELTRHTAPCRAVQFSTDGALLASGGLDGLVYVHTLADESQVVLKDHTAGVECLLFRDRRVYSGARDGKVRIHADGRFVRNYQGMRQPVLALTALGGKVMAGLSDGRIVQLNPQDATFETRTTIDAPLFAMQAGENRILIGTMGRMLSEDPPR